MKVLLKHSGLSRQTVHFYLRRGLLPKPVRTSRTYALYPHHTVELLQLIKECQSGLRLSLDEIFAIFQHSGHDPARIRRSVTERTQPFAMSAPAARVSEAESDPAPVPDGWVEELRRRAMLRSPVAGSPMLTQKLASAALELSKAGFKLDQLKNLSAQVEQQVDAELALFRAGMEATAEPRKDYDSAKRLLESIGQFVALARESAVAAGFNEKSYRTAGLFVGAAARHVLPSETLLAKMGLNREIDRLLKQLDQDPRNVHVLIDLSRAYDLRSDWHSVHGVCERVLQLDPGNVRVIAQMTRAMTHLGRPDDAIRMIEERLRVTDDPLLRFRLGQLMVRRALSGSVGELVQAIRYKREMAAEALRSAREPAVRRWIRLDIALDNLSVADPLRLNQPTVEELEDLNREYQSIPEKELSRLSRIRLTMGKLLAAYALYLVCRRHHHPRTQEIRRSIVQMDPYGVLAQRTSRRSESHHP
jgi:DNA-binding transcriptional MerR regulator